MTSKFRIFFTGFLLAMAASLACLALRGHIIEDYHVKNITKNTDTISKRLLKLNKKNSGTIPVIELKKLTASVEKEYPVMAVLFIAKNDRTPLQSLVRNTWIPSNHTLEKIKNDFKTREIEQSDPSQPVIRYYGEKEKDHAKKRFYAFIRQLQGYTLFALYPYHADMRMVTRLILEVLLAILGAVVITALIFIRGGRKNESPIPSTQPSSPRPVPEEALRPVSPSSVNEMAMKEDIAFAGARDSLSSYIFQIFGDMKSRYEPVSVALYIKTAEQVLSKTHELKGNTFLKIDSATYDTIDLTADIGQGLKENAAMVLKGGRRILIPLRHDTALLGVIVMEGEEPFEGPRLQQVRRELSDTTSELARHLVINHIMTDPVTGLYSRTFLEMQVNQRLEDNALSLVALSFLPPGLVLSEAQKKIVISMILPVIRDFLSPSDLVSRIDDTLVLLMAQRGHDGATETARSLADTLGKYRLKMKEGEVISLHMAAGISSLEKGSSRGSLINDALNTLERVEAVSVETSPHEKTEENKGEEELSAETKEPVKKTKTKQAQKKAAPAPASGKKKSKTGHGLSIGVKLISIISLIIITSLTVMTVLTTYFFRGDNEIRIKENNLKISDITALKVKTDFTALVEKAGFIAQTLIAEGVSGERSDYLSQRFFSNDRDILYVAVARPGSGAPALQHSILNKDFAAEKQVTIRDIKASITAEAAAFNKSFNLEEIVHNVSHLFKVPMVAISAPYVRKSDTAASSILILFVSVNRFNQAVSKPGITRTFIVNSDGDLIAHYNTSLVSARVNFQKLPIVKMMMTSPVDNGQTRFQDEKGAWFIASYKKIGFAGGGVISTVSEKKAFEAVRRIRFRNIVITIIVLNLAILIVYFFSKTLTGPVRRLVDATNQIEQGNFEIDIEKSTNDEIGQLTESFINMGKGLSEREKIKDAFGKFVNKEIADKVLRDEIKLGGERKDVAIFFSDIRNFTAISEKPEEVVDFLNDYMTRMVNCVNSTNGVVDKFIGDAIMAIWGAPVSHGNDTENAVNSALMMRGALIDFNKDRGGDRKPVIKIGCGINTGPALAGQIGSQDKMEYTVIGDAVNLASRIEALNKPFGTDILISEDSYELVKDIFHVEKMQEIRVKGKIEPQQIFAVLGRRDDPDAISSIEELRRLLGIEAADLKKFDPDAEEEVKYEIISEKK